MRSIKLLVVVILLVVASPTAASAQTLLQPSDVCIGVTHFPDDPIDDAPSLADFGIALPPEFAGGEVTLEMSGASGDYTATGTVESDGRVFLEAPLRQYGPHEVVSITVTIGGEQFLVDTADFGIDGTFIVDDAEPICDDEALAAALPPTTTTTSTTTTTTTTSTTTTEPPTTTAEPPTTTEPERTEEPDDEGLPSETTIPEPEGDQSDIPWPGILIGLGAMTAIAGGYMYFIGKDEKDCDRERENLAAAQRRLEMINETLQEALGDLAEHEAEIPDLEAELESYERAKRMGSTVDRGTRYYAYGGSRISEGELEAHIEYYEGRLRIAREAKARDEARVREWHEKFQRAEQEVREAQEALWRCLGESLTTAPPGAPPEEPGTTAPTSPGGTAVATTPPPAEAPRSECEDGAIYTEAGTPERMVQTVDFAIIVQVVEGTERKVGEANLLAIELAEVAANLDVLGRAFGAAGAGRSVANGLGGMRAGEYVMGAGGLAKGTAEGAMASGVADIDIPTSPPEAVTELLEGIAGLGSLVSRKVGEWLVMNQLYEVRKTSFVQDITATPYKVWECVDGRWQCRKVWQYTIGDLRRGGRTTPHSFRLESDIARHQMQSEINRLGSRAQSELAQSLQARAEFDARHQPGPCE